MHDETKSPDSKTWDSAQLLLPSLAIKGDHNEPLRVAAAWKLGRLAASCKEWAQALVSEVDRPEWDPMGSMWPNKGSILHT